MAQYEPGQTAENYLAEHRSKRKDFMSDDEIAEADLLIDWFKESWQFKDSERLFDKWELIDRYWAGHANEPVYADDVGSNTNIINPHVEGQVALSWQDPVAAYVRAVDPSDTPYQREAQAILDFVVKCNKIKATLDNVYRRLKKDGVTICSVFWDKNALNKKGMPRIRNWSAKAVYFDPAITDPQEFQESRYVILATRKSLMWATETFGEEKAAAITPGYHPVAGQWDFGTTSTWADYETENISYVHLYVMTKRNSENVRLVQMSADGVVLNETELINDQYPIFFVEQSHCENHLYGMSSTEVILPLQDTINDLDDQTIMNARLNGNPQKVVSTGSGIDLDSWTNEPGLNISANTLQDAFTLVQPQAISPDVIRQRNLAMYSDRLTIGRWSDSMMGKSQSGVDTATEAAALQTTGMAIIDSDKRKVQIMFSDVLVYSLKLCEEYWDTEMAFRITGKEEFLHIRPSKLKKIPLMSPASVPFIKKAIKKAQTDYAKSEAAFGRFVPDGALPPDFEPPKYEFYKVDGEQVYREATYDIDVDFGADMPSNKAYALSEAKNAYLAKAIDVTEYRQALHDNRILAYSIGEDEQKIVDDIKAQQKAMLAKDEAAATATIMNAAANNGIPAQGIAPMMQGMPGGTPVQGNPGATMPNATVPGMTANNVAANPATQPTLSIVGG